MSDSKHADWLRELGYQDVGTKPGQVEIACGHQLMRFTLHELVLTPHGPRPPCFFIITLELDGIPYTLSMAVDELHHQWILFSDVKTVEAKELTDVGYRDETMRMLRPMN